MTRAWATAATPFGLRPQGSATAAHATKDRQHQARSTRHNNRREVGPLQASTVGPVQVATLNTLAPDLANDLDALRTVGNFAAHPIKSTSTGDVVEVEEGEAQWIVDLLYELLDFYFVRPARRAEKRNSLNAKLADAGKPKLKGSDAP
jgi:hypothetical protein